MIPCASCGIAGVFGPEVQARSIEALPSLFLFYVATVLIVHGLNFFIEWRASRHKKKAVR